MNNLPSHLPDGVDLTPEQKDLITAPFEGSTILIGQAGTGKSTAGAMRLKHLAQQGIPGDSILVLVPQRSLAFQYYAQVQSPGFPSSSTPSILTFGGLAQRMVSLFWPLIARESGFKYPNKPCRFLTLETAQYFLATLVEPLLQQGYFDSLTIDPNRLYSQILDNLNKSAVVGFDPSEISDRLIRAWAGNPSQAIIYQQGQECALLFREFCYQNNLLDFSLQLSVFTKYLWPSLICRQFLERTFQHLIYDNIEEDMPVAHDVMADWLPVFNSALLIQDSDSGFRTFLGADPSSSSRFLISCTNKVTFVKSYVKTPALTAFENTLVESISTHKLTGEILKDKEIPFSIHPFRFYPEAMNWVTEEIRHLIFEKSIAPSEIAILTPFLSDSLRFSFSSRLSDANIQFTTYRPSRSLRDEPAVRTMLTLAKLSNPGWGLTPTQQDVCNALLGSINGCDLIRADLLSKMMFNAADISTPLRSFDPVKPDMQTRITYSVGEKYEKLRLWLLENTNQGSDILDHWISRLFGELLSQPGYRFHADFESANAIARLIESCQKFRQVLQPSGSFSSSGSGREFIRVLEQGILAAQSLTAWTEQIRSEAVFLSPAFSFLMTNRPVKYQFWIDVGSQGWWSRLDQPLTQPFVLNRNWTPGKMWTDAEEYLNNQQTLARVTTGLIRRCSQHVYMCTLGHNEQGLEERGALVMAMQTILRQINLNREPGNV